MTFETIIWLLIAGAIPRTFRWIHRPGGAYYLEMQAIYWHLQLTKQPQGTRDIKLRIAIVGPKVAKAEIPAR
jgi:hypothetical protein